MVNPTGPEADGSVATLIGGIVQDAKQLMVEQLTLFQVELKNDLRRTTTALIPLVAGYIVIAVSLVLLGMAASFGLCQAYPALPLWAGFAIVGAIFALVGGGTVVWGNAVLGRSRPISTNALTGLKENIQWKTNTQSEKAWNGRANH